MPRARTDPSFALAAVLLGKYISPFSFEASLACLSASSISFRVLLRFLPVGHSQSALVLLHTYSIQSNTEQNPTWHTGFSPEHLTRRARHDSYFHDQLLTMLTAMLTYTSELYPTRAAAELANASVSASTYPSLLFSASCSSLCPCIALWLL